LFPNMRVAWLLPAILNTLWGIQFLMSRYEAPLYPGPPANALASDASRWFGISVEQVELVARRSKELITLLYFLWSALVIANNMIRKRGFEAIRIFPQLMREHW